MPVLTLEKKAASLPSLSPALRSASNLLRQPFRMPAWAVIAAVVLVGASAFAAGRHKPAHHYVPYFAYPMVMDTTTGKACYAAPPRQSDAVTQDADFAIDGATPAAGQNEPAGQAIPMCGND